MSDKVSQLKTTEVRVDDLEARVEELLLQQQFLQDQLQLLVKRINIAESLGT